MKCVICKNGETRPGKATITLNSALSSSTTTKSIKGGTRSPFFPSSARAATVARMLRD
jgi:hypothetical protein